MAAGSGKAAGHGAADAAKADDGDVLSGVSLRRYWRCCGGGHNSELRWNFWVECALRNLLRQDARQERAFHGVGQVRIGVTVLSHPTV
jgi:hypothetical protein